jgi:hypothetical protein
MSDREWNEQQGIVERAAQKWAQENENARRVLVAAELEVPAAVACLLKTRWWPNGPLSEWEKSPEGQNHAHVTDAMRCLRRLQEVMSPRKEKP